MTIYSTVKIWDFVVVDCSMIQNEGDNEIIIRFYAVWVNI